MKTIDFFYLLAKTFIFLNIVLAIADKNLVAVVGWMVGLIYCILADSLRKKLN